MGFRKKKKSKIRPNADSDCLVTETTSTLQEFDSCNIMSTIAELAGEGIAENGEMGSSSAIKGALSSAAVSMASVTASQEMSSSSSTTTTSSSRVAKTSLSSQKFLSSEMKASSATVKSDLSELKSSISEMKNLSSSAFGRTVRSSVEDLCGLAEDEGGGGSEPLVTFPDPDTPPPGTGSIIGSPLASIGSPLGSVGSPLASTIGSPLGSPKSDLSASSNTMKFEQKRVHSASNTKVVVDGVTAERAMANTSGMKRVQAGDVTYQETQQAAQRRARLEMDGITAEKQLNMLQEKKSLKAGEITQHETQNRSQATMRVQTETFTSEKKAMAAAQESQIMSATSGLINQEKHIAQSSHQNITYKGMTTSVIQASSQNYHSQTNGQKSSLKMIEDETSKISFEDLESLSSTSTPQEVELIKKKYTEQLASAVKTIKSAKGDQCKKIPNILNRMNLMVRKAWEVPTHGHELGSSLCNALRTNGGLDFLLTSTNNEEQQFASAKLLEQCLTSENRDYVVNNGLEMVVTSACICTKNSNSVEHSRVGTGILEHLFKHSEQTCGEVIKLGGLDSVLFECRKNDVETLRHCASALANLSLYGGADNHVQMIMKKVPMWLFPLAFHNDDNIKYYACLAIAALVANKEIEAAVIKSGTLDLVEPFITSHNPYEFANSNQAHAHGQSCAWLERLVPVLSSKREEARNLAAFHFCMEAGIKKQQGKEGMFREMGAIEPLKVVASCPNAIASRFAAQALRLIGEEIPHKLSQQVPLWSTEDVSEWVKQINFAEYADNFKESRVDGDLLLQITEENLQKDIGINNGIKVKRFMRELQNLKKMADYSSRDSSDLNGFLSVIGHEYSIYTYSMLNAGVDREILRTLSEEQLFKECGIINSIHRYRILDQIRANDIVNCCEDPQDKNLDVFISYRRSNGSQLASLLKVHLQLKGFTVFIDVERLEAGKFDNNLLQSIKNAKHFILVLTQNALDKCKEDFACKDWVHREIVAALQAQCNIIPITDNFSWPSAETLPPDMRAICTYNGVTWIHDYQDACVDKLERFMKGGGGATSIAGNRPGDMTPGTPSISHKPAFNRNHSSVSVDGSDGSRD